MKDSKVARLRRGAIALRQQFAQQRGSVFSHVLGEAEIAAVVTRVRQLNAQAIDSYESGLKNVYYNRESCCG